MGLRSVAASLQLCSHHRLFENNIINIYNRCECLEEERNVFTENVGAEDTDAGSCITQ